jgi:hypothetical protein
MAKRHRIPADQIVSIPQLLTPLRPVRGEFNRYTTPAPMDIWNLPTLKAVARHSLCQVTKAKASDELQRRQ